MLLKIVQRTGRPPAPDTAAKNDPAPDVNPVRLRKDPCLIQVSQAFPLTSFFCSRIQSRVLCCILPLNFTHRSEHECRVSLGVPSDTTNACPHHLETLCKCDV